MDCTRNHMATPSMKCLLAVTYLQQKDLLGSISGPKKVCDAEKPKKEMLVLRAVREESIQNSCLSVKHAFAKNFLATTAKNWVSPILPAHTMEALLQDAAKDMEILDCSLDAKFWNGVLTACQKRTEKVQSMLAHVILNVYAYAYAYVYVCIYNTIGLG